MGQISGYAYSPPAVGTDEILILRGGANYRLTLTDVLSGEVSARSAADAVIAGDLITEINDRGVADAALQLQITNEVAARIAGDNAKINTSYLDTDGTLAANSDTKIATQKATKTYVDGRTATATTTTAGILEVATDPETLTGSADDKIVTPLKLRTNVPLYLASGNYSIVQAGGSNVAGGDNAFAIGTNSSAESNNTFCGGFGPTVASGVGSFVYSTNDGTYLGVPITQTNGTSQVILGGRNSEITSGDYTALLGCENTVASAAYVVGLGSKARTLDQANTTYAETIRSYGGIQRYVNTITTNSTLTYAQDIIFVDTTAGNVTVTLPANPVEGQIYAIQRTSAGANTLTVDGNGYNINGSATYTGLSSQYSKISLIFSGSEWFR